MSKEINKELEPALLKDWKESEFFHGHHSNTYVVYEAAYMAGATPYLNKLKEAEKEAERLKETEAIAFATWVENNGYVRFDKYYWTNDECETRLSDQQLYHKFKTKQ